MCVTGGEPLDQHDACLALMDALLRRGYFVEGLGGSQFALPGAVDRLRADAAGGFPEKVTAFRKDMAVHGKFGKPCPACGTKGTSRLREAWVTSATLGHER